MADKSSDPTIADALSAFADEMGKAAATAYQTAMGEWLKAWQAPLGTSDARAGGVSEINRARPAIDPGKLVANQMELMRDYHALWLATMQRLMNRDVPPVVEPEDGDKRFRDAAWSESPIFDLIKQSYLLNARWLRKTLAGVEGLDADTARRLEFYGRAMVDAMAPTNFPLTNPVVLRETVETKGENLRRGLASFLEDIKVGGGRLRPRQTDMSAFEVGRNIAVSPGAVVFENDLFQLLQYEPTTATVHQLPLIIVPPWINKFYILDLRPDNSFIAWAVAQGYTVFVMSWVNPDERYARYSFADYLESGIFAALDAIERATGERRLAAIGYCVGGTLLAMALAYMAAKGDERIAATTFLAAQVDFEDAGDLRVFTSAAQIDALATQVEATGYLDAGSMATTFNALRANDLIWSYVVNNYLLGKDPPVFDLLYWNADSTRFPARLLVDYLRGMYLENRLAKPGGFVIDGVPIELSRIGIPIYIQASREDHIAPAPSVFKAMRVLGGPKRFMLAGSGHIAGVINPPGKNKYQHWINTRAKTYADLDAWLADAEERPGSWWPDWNGWLAPLSGPEVPARNVGEGKLKPLEPAPGSFVKVKS